MIERLVQKLNFSSLTRVWIEGNIKWLVRLVFFVAMFIILVGLDLVFDSLLIRILWILNLVVVLFLFRCTGLKNGLFLKPIYILPGEGKNLALTFDDGPHPENTLKLLEIMEKNGVQATFFLTGTQIEKYPDIAMMITEKGHEIGSHGYSHCNMSRMGMKQLDYEFFRFKGVTEKIGIKQSVMFRPPHGLKSPLLEWYSLKHGLKMVHWNLSPKDWKSIPDDIILSRLAAYTRPGSIILLHDSSNAVAVLENYIQAMVERGYCFRKVSDFL